MLANISDHQNVRPSYAIRINTTILFFFAGGLSGSQMHICKNCGNVYVYYSSLTRHLREECGKLPKYQCLYCPKRSKLHCNLLKHMRTKHGFEQGWEYRKLPGGCRACGTTKMRSKYARLIRIFLLLPNSFDKRA